MSMTSGHLTIQYANDLSNDLTIQYVWQEGHHVDVGCVVERIDPTDEELLDKRIHHLHALAEERTELLHTGIGWDDSQMKMS